MSQKKVDAYKEQKANRQKIMKREKMILRIEKIGGLAVCILAVCWLGFSVYDKATAVEDTGEKIVTEMDTTALDNYLSGLTADAEAAE